MNQPYRHIHALHLRPPPNPPYLTPRGPHMAPSWAPCVIQQLHMSYLFYTQQCIHVSSALPIHLTLPAPALGPQVHALRLYLYSCPANRLVYTICLDTFWKNTVIQKDTCTTVFIAALFIIASTWKQPKCPLTDKWIKKIWYICTMECYSVIKRNYKLGYL